MSPVKIDDKISRELHDFADLIGKTADDVADEVLREFLAWQKNEVETIKQARREAKDPQNLIPADEVWKKFGL